MLRNCKKFVRKLARRLIVHPSLDPALHIAVPEGHGLGEMCQLSGSNEGDSREGREKKNAREGTCLAPSRGMREREREIKPKQKNAVKAKEPNQQGMPRANLIKEKRANFGKKMKNRVWHLI